MASGPYTSPRVHATGQSDGPGLPRGGDRARGDLARYFRSATDAKTSPRTPATLTPNVFAGPSSTRATTYA
jgi:hypothetical protein